MQKPPENWHLRYDRFVLLRSRRTHCPDVIRSIIRDVGSQVSEVHDPLNALAELCALDRWGEPRRRNGIDSEQKIALLVIEPGTLEQLPDLYETIKTYLPHVNIIPIESTADGVIIFEMGSEDTQISAVEPPPTPPVPEEADPVERPYLRYTGGSEEPVENPEDVEESAETADSEHDRTESPEVSNPEDPPQRRLTKEEEDRLRGRYDPDASPPERGEE